jgi:arylsulfatase A-like enzyme
MADESDAEESFMISKDPRESSSSAAQPSTATAPVVLGVWLGLVFAALNLLVIAVKQTVLDRIAFVSGDVWWTLPLTMSLTFAVIGVAFALLFRHRRDLGWRSVLFVCVLIGATSVLSNYHALHPIAVLVLAAGVAVQATRLATAHHRLVTTTVRRTVVLFAICVLAGGVAVRGNRWWHERQAIQALPTPPRPVPNVLLVVLDTVRAADLSLYGYSRDTTPNLVRFATKGALFTTALSTAPWTLPSHASMLTGRLESELSADWVRPLNDGFPTLAEALASRGYATGAFVGNTLYVNREVGLARGFARFDSETVQVGQLLNNDPLGQVLLKSEFFDRMFGLGKVPYCKKAPAVSQPFLKWVSDQNVPWFALLNYYDAHEPYDPPATFMRRFASPDLEPDPKAGDENPESPWTSDDAERFRAAYDGGIAYLDAELGGLFDSLERKGLLSNTLVIVTSDHGEEFGEHGWFGHGDSLYLPALHVPLIVVGPQGVPAGTLVTEPVSLRDIPATVLHLVDGSHAFPGRSLAERWTPGPPPGNEIVVAGVRRVLGRPESHPLTAGGAIALIDSRYHYVHHFGSGREELFDYRADPWERSDLASGSAAIRAELDRFRLTVDKVPGVASVR